MPLVLSAHNRERFRTDLLKHRSSFPLSDAEYARSKLGISLNTYKKCVENGGETLPLHVARHTFVNICERASLDPAAYGLQMALPRLGAEYGGYSKEDFGFLQGRYNLYRRSFLTGLNINRSVLDIAWSDEIRCLTFHERLRYVSDRGVPQEFDYSGLIYMHQERVLMSFLATDHGELRLMLVHTPDRPKAGRPRTPFKLRGLLLTHAYPKGFFQPTLSPVFIIEASRNGREESIETLCKTLTPGDSEHELIETELQQIEEQSTVITSLLRRA